MFESSASYMCGLMSGVGIVIIAGSPPQAPARKVRAREAKGNLGNLILGDLRVRDIRMTGWSRSFGIAVMAGGCMLGAGCAKDATSVVVIVAADGTVPPLLILRTTVAHADDPATQSSAER